MADLPQPQSYEQILSDMLSAYAAKQGIDDFNVGSAVTSFFEVVALSTARSSGDIFQILKDFSVDRATGDALQRLAQENNVTPKTAQPATGAVNIIDTSFTKVSTKIYAGTNPPNIGSTSVNISSNVGFPGTGAIYIGRGTPNIEGPIAYTSIVANGSFFTINLSSATTKFHNLGETVILSQGGIRSIPLNSVVISPGVGSTSDLQYQTTVAATILDGETEVDNVPVTALTPGSSGNIPISAIKSFASQPFSGATVTNSLPFTTGADTETDDQLRVRIKRSLASTGLGTATAIQNAVIGAVAPDENDTIQSASLLTDATGAATVYIDDGTGYEAKSAGVGLESIVDSAIGGEQFFQLATGGTQAPVAKAFLESSLTAPFDLIGGDTLAIIVGGVTYQHVFANSDFRSPGGATAFEITASVNGDTALGFEATTAGGGTLVVFRSKIEGNDAVQVATPTTSGRNAAVLLGLPSNEVDTLRLYKNDIPLSKDGNTAEVFSQTQQLWSNTIVTGDTLVLSVDGTANITYTILDADFIATGLYTSVANTNSLQSWAQVLNSKLTGVTVAVLGEQLTIISNLGANNRANVTIDPSSTLVTKGMFSSLIGLSSSGKASDFSLDRNTAQFQLVKPLVAGDKLTAGSNQTQARIESSAITGGSITFSSDAHVWFLVDSPGSLVATGVASNTLLSVATPSTNIVRYGSVVSGAFSNVQVGDYVIIWSQELVSADRLEGRVHAVTSTTLDILITSAEWAAIAVTAGVLYNSGFVVLRSNLVPQKFKIAAGAYTLDQVAVALQAQTSTINFSVLEEQFLVALSANMSESGSLFVVSADTSALLMNWPVGTFATSQSSLTAFYDSSETEADFPLFVHSGFAADEVANPIDSYVTSFSSAISLASRDPNELIAFLHPYGTIKDAQPYGEHVQESAISGTTINITHEPNLSRLRSGVDRYYIASPLDFGYQDSAVVILDEDTTNKSFSIPFYRRSIANTTFSSSMAFNAYDVDSGATAPFVNAFGSFDFSNFKALMRAHKVLTTSSSNTALLYRAAQWGRSGQYVNVGYVYPSVPNSGIGSTVTVTSAVNISINLQSGAPVSSAIDATTQWNVTVTPNTPSAGIDQVTYTWNTVGTAPALTLSGGEYVNITNQTLFSAANVGVFRVSTQSGFTPTATSFSVQRPTGVAVAESGKATQVNGAITFYQASATTANAVLAYVNANLSQYISAALANWMFSNNGSGTIARSTYEDSGFTFASVQLQDGINWIASSNLSGSPQFTFKVPLTLPTDTGYAFNNGEEVRLIPTTMDQAKRLTSVLAVSGFTTVGTIGVSDRGNKLELSTDILGSSGAIQVIGGSANQYSLPVLDSAARLDNTYMQISADIVASQPMASDQWFRLQAAQAQTKSALFSSNTSVAVAGNNPTVGQSLVTLSGRLLTQRYFGKPRNHVRSRADGFRVEKQGNLVCLSWDPNVGSTPVFSKASLNFNDSGGGTLNVALISGTSEAQYIILTGNANFTELSIGDLVTVAGLPQAANNGTFLVTGVQDNGKVIQVLNPNAKNEYSSGTFTFNTNAVNGDQFTIGATTLTAVASSPGPNQFLLGGSNTATAANFSAVVGTISGVTSAVVGNVVTVTATAPQATIAISTTSSHVTTSGSVLVGDSFVAGNFSASSSVSEGDSVLMSAPFNVLNQGKFRVIRRYNDSIWLENPNVVEEEVTLPYNSVSLGFDSSTSFKVNASGNTAYLNWNGVGTEPFLGNATVGDIVTFGIDFTAVNRGDYMVRRSGAKLQQISQLQMPAGTQFTIGGAGTYFTINSAGNVNQYYVWFNVNGSNSDPAPIGLTGLMVAILSGDTSTSVATKTAIVLNGATGLGATSASNVVTVTTTGFIETNDPANVNVPSPFVVTVIQEGRRTFLECINPSAVNQSTVFVSSGVLQCHRPQLQFYEYEATVPGDLFVTTGNTLTSANAGSYSIVRILDQDNAIITGTLASTSASLNGRETSVYIQEGVPYSGYKHVYLVSAEPGASTRNFITFDTNAVYEKINESSGVEMTSLNKMDFSTVLRSGLDSYRYNTGLIREANRIIYGDPRDPATYPGVGAAGAEIFVREPLTLRVQVSVDVRLNTGVPFSQTATQVRSSVGSLINSNPVGNSIAISDIVAAVSSIPGVKSVSIASPLYDVANDLIVVAPSEKTRVIDPTIDISVSQIGS